MEQAVIDAVRDGDLSAVRRHLNALPVEAQWQDEGRALAGEMVRWGGPGLTQLLYEDGEAVPSGPWGDVDPVVWAAEHGASGLLERLLSQHPVPEDTLRGALDAARAWLDVDPEAELRRRSGAGEDDAVTVARDHLTADEHSPRALRIRLTAVDGRRAEVLAGHRAVVTALEKRLDLPVSRDELLARALWSADPESYDWQMSRQAVMTRFPAEDTFRWAAGRLADPEVVVRGFAAELLQFSTLDGEAADAPYAADALVVLRDRMAVETDTETLCSVLGAYAGFSEIGAILHEFLPFVLDDRPQVRSRAADGLLNGIGGPADDPPRHVLEAMLNLTRDPDPTVRAVATAQFVYSAIDVPALRDALAALMSGDDREVRVHAASGLALRGDAHALAELRRMGEEDGYDSLAWCQLDSVQRMLAPPTR
ncbi:HEAT repeat domain-containing protein [Micromonospora arborensis]|uniref:HEAT repeat domain-containing protein n=1 Tax=Micromonospora arborensis TaxID=2116518 RepID=UPI0034384ACE